MYLQSRLRKHRVQIQNGRKGRSDYLNTTEASENLSHLKSHRFLFVTVGFTQYCPAAGQKSMRNTPEIFSSNRTNGCEYWPTCWPVWWTRPFLWCQLPIVVHLPGNVLKLWWFTWRTFGFARPTPLRRPSSPSSAPFMANWIYLFVNFVSVSFFCVRLLWKKYRNFSFVPVCLIFSRFRRRLWRPASVH